jgi:integrase
MLSRDEVKRLLEVTTSKKYKAAFSVAYGAGLRVSEVVNLKVSDIDSQLTRLRTEQGKGKKDRYARPSVDVFLKHLKLRLSQPVTSPGLQSADFIPISVHESAQSADDRGFVILEVGSIKVHWLMSQIQHSIAWLRALQS